MSDARWVRTTLRDLEGNVADGWALADWDAPALAVVVRAGADGFRVSVAWTANGQPRWHAARTLDEALTCGALLAGVAWV